MTKKSCIFCKIIGKELPANIEYEDDDIIVFHDINPDAKVHILIVPKKHTKSINELKEGDREVLGKMFLIAKEVALKMSVAESGYRLIVNTGKDGGQLVDHLHMHLLGGERLDRARKQ